MEVRGHEDQRAKRENPAGMDFLASLEPLDPQATPASARSEKRVSQVTRGPRAVPAVPAIPAPDTWERLASVASLETPAFLDCRVSRAYLDREAKCCLAPFLVRTGCPACPAYLDDQVAKVSLVSLVGLELQDIMDLKERGENPALEASLDRKGSPDPEEIPAFPAALQAATTEPKGRTVSPAAPEPKASPERFWEPRREPRDRAEYRDLQETRASRGLPEDPDHPVVTDVPVSPGRRESVAWTVYRVSPACRGRRAY